jgi:hypothetical protein
LGKHKKKGRSSFSESAGIVGQGQVIEHVGQVLRLGEVGAPHLALVLQQNRLPGVLENRVGQRVALGDLFADRGIELVVGILGLAPLLVKLVFKLGAGNDFDVLNLPHCEDKVVRRDQIICLGGERGLDDGIVVRVAGNVPANTGRQDDESCHAKNCFASQECIPTSSPKVFREFPGQLIKNVLGNIKPHTLPPRTVEEAVAITSL